MSALRGEADEDQRPSERLLIAISGHSLVRWVFLGVLGADRLGAGLHLCRLVATTGLASQGGVVLQARGHARVLRPQGLLLDRQRPTVE